MRLEQSRRERSHREAAEEATDTHEVDAEERRAEKAAYLREKLGERARSEEEADSD